MLLGMKVNTKHWGNMALQLLDHQLNAVMK